MDRKAKVEELAGLIAGIVDHYQKLNVACAEAQKAGCLDLNGPLSDAIWRLFEHLLNRIEERQMQGWLCWFIYENECGAKALQATVGKRKLRKVRNARDLARLIVLDAERDLHAAG